MQAISSLYRGTISIGTFLQPFILLLIRLYWGFAFFQTGWGKLNHIDMVINYFTNLGIPAPAFNAYLVGGLEMIGGLCLLFGFVSRLAAIFLSINMIVALLTAHTEATVAFFSSLTSIYENAALVIKTGSNFVKQDPFNYLLASLIVLGFGPGAISIDYFIEKRAGGR